MGSAAALIGVSIMSPTTTKQSVPSSPPKRMTVAEFEQLADLLGDDRVELIDGHIVGRGEMKPAHVLATELVNRAIEPVLRSGRFIRADKPVRIPDFNEPFPDLAVARGDPRAYADRHPGPEDVSLLIEVSDTTLDGTAVTGGSITRGAGFPSIGSSTWSTSRSKSILIRLRKVTPRGPSTRASFPLSRRRS